MMIFNELNNKNFLMYAAKSYYRPKFSDIDEFYEDLKRFKYLKRLINRYFDTGELAERLILNHLIIIFNVFEFKPALRMCEFKFNEKQLSVLKPFLIHQKYILYNDLLGIDMDNKVVEVLRKQWEY